MELHRELPSVSGVGVLLPIRGDVRIARLIAVTLALAAGSAACASSGAIPKPFPGATGAADSARAVASGVPRFSADAVARTALSFRGIPYRDGGSDPAGFDCSGFVQYIFAQHGLPLPRQVREQFAFGHAVKWANARQGDLIFFSTAGKGPSHVGVVIGGDEFVHAPSERGVVRVERFSARYWATRVVAIKRLG